MIAQLKMLDLQVNLVLNLLSTKQLVATNLAIFYYRVVVVLFIELFLFLKRDNMLILYPFIEILI